LTKIREREGLPEKLNDSGKALHSKEKTKNTSGSRKYFIRKGQEPEDLEGKTDASTSDLYPQGVGPKWDPTVTMVLYGSDHMKTRPDAGEKPKQHGDQGRPQLGAVEKNHCLHLRGVED